MCFHHHSAMAFHIPGRHMFGLYFLVLIETSIGFLMKMPNNGGKFGWFSWSPFYYHGERSCWWRSWREIFEHWSGSESSPSSPIGLTRSGWRNEWILSCNLDFWSSFFTVMFGQSLFFCFFFPMIVSCKTLTRTSDSFSTKESQELLKNWIENLNGFDQEGL